MKLNSKLYKSLSKLMEYPGDVYPDLLNDIESLIENDYPEASKVFQKFGETVSPLSKEALQEIYTRTFEVQAVTTLDLGYLMFGEDYKRGQLLANLSNE